jgi:LysR family transcriptional regulator, glycine cleavage system transcriptional activator
LRKLPPLAALRAFEAAARHLSFKDAAAEIGVTPSAISHQVRLLEDTCGHKLFRRQPRPIALTPEGRRLFPVLRGGFDTFAAAMADLDGEQESGPLRVTCPGAFAHYWLIPRLPDWRAAQPGVDLEVIGSDAVADLHGDAADVAIRYARSPPADMVARELFRDRYVPVCRPDLLGPDPLPETRRLLDLPLIHFDWFKPDVDTPNWENWWTVATTHEPDLPPLPAPSLRFREEMHAIEAVLAGQGAAICSDIVLGDALRDGRLCRAHDLVLPGYGFYLAHLSKSPRHELLDQFGAWLEVCAAVGRRSAN